MDLKGMGLIFVLWVLVAGVWCQGKVNVLRPSGWHREEQEQWVGEVEDVVAKILQHHPDPFYRITRKDFQEAVQRHIRNIRHARHADQCLVNLMQTVALLEDGHTLLEYTGAHAPDLWFPICINHFPEGLFVTATSPKFRELLGCRVIALGQVPAREAHLRVQTVQCADNLYKRREDSTQFLSNARILHGLGILEDTDSLPLTVVSSQRQERTVRLPAFRGTYNLDWARRRNTGPEGPSYLHAFFREIPLPLHLRHNGARDYLHYWYELLPDDRILYFQFNRVVHQEGYRFEAFRKDFWDFVDQNADRIDKLVIDLRTNRGGNGTLLFPFLHELIRHERLNTRGHLYVLCGAGSYSAAPVLMAQMKLHTEVIFVGEPTGNAFNFFSDARTFGVTPHFGYTVRIATRHLDLNWPSKKESAVFPHVPAPMYARDYFLGRDPALELIRQGELLDAETIFWRDGPQAALDYYKRINVAPWAADFFHTSSYQRCYEEEFHGYASFLIGKGQLEKALEVLTISLHLFPDAWCRIWELSGEAWEKKGNLTEAIACYRKSLKDNPDQEAIARRIERLGLSLRDRR